MVERETFEVPKQKTTFETSYYVSNLMLETSAANSLVQEMAQAIRYYST
ncbi:hypothetical protein [Bathymodiolus platifrons methanotrophic gill symbiont]|nr:hypothetical protein [Bathymodiolus platifrons methanotrophic gill symbiont]